MIPRSSGLAQTLAKSALLRDLPTSSLERLASVARRRTYRRDEVIVHEGDPGDSLYVLESGQVKIVSYTESGRETIFDMLVPGECFGELSLIDQEPRSATAPSAVQIRVRSACSSAPPHLVESTLSGPVATPELRTIRIPGD